MQTRKLYHDDPRKVDFDATLLSCEPRGKLWEIVLDQTAFYPEGGGQPADHGWIDEVEVTNVSVADGTIRHEVAAPVAGPQVHGRIDWGRRFDFMQQHTGQHIVSASFERVAGLHTVSVHLGESYTSVELDAAALSSGILDKVEEEANSIIQLNVPVTARYVTPSEAASLALRKPPPNLPRIRVVQIEGYDLSACGGTHCASTGEVGLVKGCGLEVIRGHVRIAWKIGRRAYRDYRAKSELVASLAKELTCSEEELAARVAALGEERRSAQTETAKLERRLAERMAADIDREALPSSGLNASAQSTGPGARAVRCSSRIFEAEREAVARAVAERLASIPDLVSILVNDTGEQLRLFIAAGAQTGVDAGAIGRAAAAAVSGSGGGKGTLWQGAGRKRDAGAFVETATAELLRFLGGR